MNPQPFLGSRAIRTGAVTPYSLRTRFRRVFRDVYVSKHAELSAADIARAAWLFADGKAVMAGTSAAALHGTKWLDPRQPAEMIRADRHGPPGIVVHSWELTAEEVCDIRGIRVTTPARTAYDIGRMVPAQRAIPILDALLNATGVKPSDVLALTDGRPGARGVRRLQDVLGRVDAGAESPQETRVRLLLVDAGLPAPETQIEFRDRFGAVRIRVDMGWPQWKVAVEYDGVQHWTDSRQRSWDIDRIALLEQAGWVVVRVSAEMLSRPHVFLERVRAKLCAAGCPL